ncbi:MAG TPA: hypothetical protein VK728_04355 [Candidatus Sulfotelmatobacter sp.]|jgi:hypothetical protein|nr:hypothetical protein [Candidatus Sulfotelmatobacter sp.]
MGGNEWMDEGVANCKHEEREEDGSKMEQFAAVSNSADCKQGGKNILQRYATMPVFERCPADETGPQVALG